jgi:type IV pilus assembly protein PilOP
MARSLTLKTTPKNTKAIAAVAAGILAFTLLGYLVLISPQRSRVKELNGEIQTTQTQILTAQLASRVKPVNPRVDDLFRLTKAMPAGTDMPGILLELSHVASATGITFDSITPGQPVAAGSFQTLPIQLAFHGTYYELSDFLFRLRNLVAQRDGRLDVDGRLYSVDNLNFAQGDKGSTLTASLSTKAYIYGSGSVPTTGTPSPTTPASTGGTG